MAKRGGPVKRAGSKYRVGSGKLRFKSRGAACRAAKHMFAAGYGKRRKRR